MAPETLRLTAPESAGRLDKFLADRTGLTRTWVQHLIDEGVVAVNGRAAKASYKLEPGDEIEATLLGPPVIDLQPQAIPINVVHQDADLIVVDKPAGLTVHPAPGHPDKTLVNAILAVAPDLQVPSLPEPVEGRRRASLRQAQDKLSTANAYLRPGIVHRLDKDTSGLMVVAKSPAAQEHLARQMRERTMTKEYQALLEGRLTPEHGAIDAPIGRDPRRRDHMAVLERGRSARTGYRVLEHIGSRTLVLATLETGRTHQIRVHFAAIGHPITGDPLYGKAVEWCPRQFLHACRLGFSHPHDGRWVEFTAELPQDLVAALAKARALVS
jgi:23S rRNA pseudouridine1911/1915/1917 synthase